MTEQLIIDARHEHAVFDRVFYERTRFWSSTFSTSTWRHCKFYGTSFANACHFTACRFEECRFWGQHTHFGGPALFERCIFDRCSFKDVTFWEASFQDCVFRGTMQNVVFFGSEGPPEWLTIFKDVDLSAMTLDLVDFRLGFDLSSTRLPASAMNHGSA